MENRLQTLKTLYFFEFLYLEIMKTISHVKDIGLIIKFIKQNKNNHGNNLTTIITSLL